MHKTTHLFVNSKLFTIQIKPSLGIKLVFESESGCLHLSTVSRNVTVLFSAQSSLEMKPGFARIKQTHTRIHIFHAPLKTWNYLSIYVICSKQKRTHTVHRWRPQNHLVFCCNFPHFLLICGVLQRHRWLVEATAPPVGCVPHHHGPAHYYPDSDLHKPAWCQRSLKHPNKATVGDRSSCGSMLFVLNCRGCNYH